MPPGFDPVGGSFAALAEFVWKKLIGILTHPAGGAGIVADLGSGYSVEDDEALKRAKIVNFARSQQGKPYKFGIEIDPDKAADAVAWDCSEFTSVAYQSAASLTLPDGCVYQQAFCQKVNTQKPADLIFLGPNKNGIRHVLMLTGDGTVIHAKGGVGVIEEDASSWLAHIRFEGVYRHPEFSRGQEDRI